jgi:two-component system, NarL family, response regulator DesR
MLRLLCVEDDPLVATYLATRLGLEADIEVAGVVETAGEALAFLERETVDLVLLDYHLRGVDGMQLLAAIRRDVEEDGAPEVLFCTGVADQAFLEQALQMGAAGVVTKDQMAASLLPALRAVGAGARWFPGVPGAAPFSHR